MITQWCHDPAIIMCRSGHGNVSLTKYLVMMVGDWGYFGFWLTLSYFIVTESHSYASKTNWWKIKPLLSKLGSSSFYILDLQLFYDIYIKHLFLKLNNLAYPIKLCQPEGGEYVTIPWSFRIFFLTPDRKKTYYSAPVNNGMGYIFKENV